MQDMNLANNDGDRVDPATENLQRDLLVEFVKRSSSTDDIKFQSVTVGAANDIVAPGQAHGCKKVYFWTADTTVSVGDEDSQPCLLIQNIIYSLPINAVQNLRFKGTAGGEVVYLISSN